MSELSPAASDLLFGLIAQQMGIVTREQLLEAASLWFDDPNRALRTTLAELHGLQPDDAELVSGAVDAHSGDGADTSARIDSDVRTALIELRPPAELRAWLESLPPRGSVAAAAGAVPLRNGRYTLGAEIARGGLGRVVEAMDRDLNREVAIKLVLDEARPEAVNRFLREARLTAKLDHPNIVPIHEFGRITDETGRPRLFLSMKRIRGRDLASLLEEIADGGPARTEWSRPRLLGLLEDVCLGIAFAHSKGVIHRDLKPSNIMVGDYGETLIVDWGLAREQRPPGAPPPDPAPAVPRSAAAGSANSSDTTLTMVGDVLGTPAYMAPEQASLHPDAVDERTDVFALGAILYAMLTLRPPWEGATNEAVLDCARAGRIVPAAVRVENLVAAGKTSVETVPPDLDAICTRATAARPADRTPSARTLALELRMFLEGVAERDRRVREAAEAAAEGLVQLERYRAHVREAAGHQATLVKLSQEVPTWSPLEKKATLWDAQERSLTLEDAIVEAATRAQASFDRALQADGACAVALDGRCDLLTERYLEAEKRRDRRELRALEVALEEADGSGRARARIDAPGKLEVRAFTYACRCLERATDPAWDVQFSQDHKLAWRRGRPDPTGPVKPEDTTVPAIAISPAGKRFGHGPGCPRTEARGVPVFAAPIRESRRRLLPGAEVRLGDTPLAAIELPRGTWSITLRPTDGRPPITFPVRIEREATWSQEVALLSPADIPPGFLHVPAGPYLHTNRSTGVDQGLETRELPGFLMSRFAITCGEYLEFLNALAASDRLEEARRRIPRDATGHRWREEAGRFRFPTVAEDPFAWQPTWPAFLIDWQDTLAWCAWRSKVDGRVYTLPTEEEFEKAARGVDGRTWAFGDTYDASYAHGSQSLEAGTRPLPVGTFEGDESPYGVRDLSGCVATLLFEAAPEPNRRWRMMKGGSWTTTPSFARVGMQHGSRPTATNLGVGFRVVCRLEAWPDSPGEVVVPRG